MNNNKLWVYYIAGIVMAFIFGHTFIFTKRALINMSPMVLLSYRFLIAAVVLTLLLLFKVVKLEYRGKKIKNLIFLSAFYPVISFAFETIGVQYTSTSQAGIMVSLMPIFVMVLSITFLKERPSNTQKLFILISVFGVIFTVAFSKNNQPGTLLGLTFLIISVISGAVYNILSRKCSNYFTPIEITFVMIWVGAIFFNIVSLAKGLMNNNLYDIYILPIKSTSSLVSILYLSVFASVIAFFAMNYMLSNLPAVNASVFTNLATIISIFAGVIIENETLCWHQIVGGMFIILGVWGTNYFHIITKTIK